jgi:signal transduction histidine kinase/CheY-like chemotaxis protein
MDYERNLTILARLSLPKLGEWCAIDIVQENDKGTMALRRITSQHRDPHMQTILTEMDRRYPHLRDAPAGPANVVRTGQKELINVASDDIIASLAEDEEHLQMLRQLGFRSVMIVPLMARGRRLGAMSFYSSKDRQFDMTDLDLAEDLTRRAAYYVDNAQLYQQVRAADRRKDEFLATLAHELRNPLAPIMNAFEILRKRVGDHPDLDPLHETVRRQIQHLVRLINDLVDVSRITRGKIALRMERTRLETLAHQAADTSQPLIDARRQKLILDLSSEPLWLAADPARLIQVIANLLNNASKYTHAGGCIWLTTERDGDQAVLRVRDNGSGIEPDLLPQVFDLFTQGDRSLDRVEGGLGIGLTIVRNLVEDHHGQVLAFSEGVGRGSEFVVRFPLADGERPEVAEPQAVRAGPPRRIVLVEDNRDARETLERLLSLDGHSVQTAEDGPTGLERILAVRPEVALVDVGLPRLDGYGVAAEVRKQLGSAVQLVALTGYGNPEDRQRAFLSGFDSHLVKPVTLDDLRRLLQPTIPSGPRHETSLP